MLNKKILILAIFLVSLLAVSVVSAADNSTDDMANVDDATDDVVNVNVNENDDIQLEEVDDSVDEIVSSSAEDDDALSLEENEDVLDASPPYNKYKLSVSDTTMTYGQGGSIKVSITPVNGYSYKYDFYLRVYDSSNNQKINKNYYSSTSATSITHTIGATELQPGSYTIKLVNYADSQVMATAKLTVKSSSSSSSSPPYSAYSVTVYDTSMNYGSSGSISMSITPASSYYYKYDFYLRVYDSYGNQKINQRYYSTSSSYSKTYSVGSTALNPGSYTIKIINAADNQVMKTAKLTVKSPTYYNAYSVSVYDTSFTYGINGGSISMSISPASTTSYIYAYDFYLKVYDSKNNQKISQRYYSTSAAYSKTYNLGSTSLNPGIYTIKIINNADSKVMSTAKLTVKEVNIDSQDVSGYCDGVVQFKARISDDNEYKSGFTVTFTCNGKEYSATTDDKGYASFEVHLKSGTYSVTTRCLSTNKNNKITVNKKYVANKFKKVKVKAPNAYYKQSKKKITYSFEGNLKGYFKIYKGKSLKYSKKINTNGYIDDYFKYKKHSYSYAINKLKDVGKYSVKIVDSNGKVLAKSKFRIKKAPTKIEGESFTARVGTKDYTWVYVHDKQGNSKYITGKFKVKFRGKTYKAKVKKGWALIDNLKIPLKEKTYKGSIKYLGDKHYKASHGKFKVRAVKGSSKITVKSFSVTVGKKHTIKAKVKDLFDGKNVKKGVVKFKINGRTYKAKIKNGVAKIKITAPLKAKKYTCKATYLGDKKTKKSSKTFKMKVKKKKRMITLSPKLNKWTSKRNGKYRLEAAKFKVISGIWGYWIDVDINLFKNGKQLKPGKYLSRYKYTYHGKSYWCDWRRGNEDHAYHRYVVVDHDMKIKKVQVKY